MIYTVLCALQFYYVMFCHSVLTSLLLFYIIDVLLVVLHTLWHGLVVTLILFALVFCKILWPWFAGYCDNVYWYSVTFCEYCYCYIVFLCWLLWLCVTFGFRGYCYIVFLCWLLWLCVTFCDRGYFYTVWHFCWCVGYCGCVQHFVSVVILCGILCSCVGYCGCVRHFVTVVIVILCGIFVGVLFIILVCDILWWQCAGYCEGTQCDPPLR